MGQSRPYRPVSPVHSGPHSKCKLGMVQHQRGNGASRGRDRTSCGECHGAPSRKKAEAFKFNSCTFSISPNSADPYICKTSFCLTTLLVCLSVMATRIYHWISKNHPNIFNVKVDINQRAKYTTFAYISQDHYEANIKECILCQKTTVKLDMIFQLGSYC